MACSRDFMPATSADVMGRASCSGRTSSCRWGRTGARRQAGRQLRVLAGHQASRQAGACAGRGSKPGRQAGRLLIGRQARPHAAQHRSFPAPPQPKRLSPPHLLHAASRGGWRHGSQRQPLHLHSLALLGLGRGAHLCTGRMGNGRHSDAGQGIARPERGRPSVCESQELVAAGLSLHLRLRPSLAATPCIKRPAPAAAPTPPSPSTAAAAPPSAAAPPTMRPRLAPSSSSLATAAWVGVMPPSMAAGVPLGDTAMAPAAAAAGAPAAGGVGAAPAGKLPCGGFGAAGSTGSASGDSRGGQLGSGPWAASQQYACTSFGGSSWCAGQPAACARLLGRSGCGAGLRSGGRLGARSRACCTAPAGAAVAARGLVGAVATVVVVLTGGSAGRGSSSEVAAGVAGAARASPPAHSGRRPGCFEAQSRAGSLVVSLLGTGGCRAAGTLQQLQPHPEQVEELPHLCCWARWRPRFPSAPPAAPPHGASLQPRAG